MEGPLLTQAGVPERAHTPESRLAAAAALATLLAPLRDPAEIGRCAVEDLHARLGYAVVLLERLDADGFLRGFAVGGAEIRSFAEQSADQGINGRVARTGAPVVVADAAEEPHELRIDAGAAIVVSVPVDGAVWGVLTLQQPEPDTLFDTDLLAAEAAAAQLGAALHRAELLAGIESAFVSTLGVLSGALETSDEHTASHAEDVADLAAAVSARLGLDAPSVRTIRYAALLHDIGKAGVRSEVLTKPGRLSDAEFMEMAQHTLIGERMLSQIPFFRHVHPLVRSAHERWDGRGYPDGLEAEAIPLGARVVCACDAFHAMTSNRPYRRAMSVAEAKDELAQNAGTQFDPAVVEALLAELADR